MHSSERPIIQQQKHDRQSNDHGLGHQAHGEQERDCQVAGNGRLADVPSVGSEREQKEKHAENVLAFRYPGDGLHIKRMHGKERGHHQAARGVSGEPLQNQEQQQRVAGVQ